MEKLRYNPNNVKPGSVFYSVYVDYDDNESKPILELDEWHVRSIRAKSGSMTRNGKKITGLTETRPQVNLILKDSVTWIKRTKRHGDWGWAYSIPNEYRRQFLLGETPFGLFTTPLQALKDAKKRVEGMAQRGVINSDEENQMLQIVKSRITRLRNKAIHAGRIDEKQTPRIAANADCAD